LRRWLSVPSLGDCSWEDKGVGNSPRCSPLTSGVLVVIGFRLLVEYSDQVARSIRNPSMIGAIVDDLCVAAGSPLVPNPGEGTGSASDDAVRRW